MVLFAENDIISFVVDEADLSLQSILTSTPVAKKTLEAEFLKEILLVMFFFSYRT